ncbi:hypothetical protein HG536_0D00960 [Torulaspora globosa]|uniref:Altered inheritance of mitochondria protein 4 n=1 Tax=Torulaspora globosa TaxID=48254 RepID=A0A7G3ZGD8_9SACH|nr:uncharacterized protein HG536_0D00960 [Torulaspora globosa]QLL32574.1 hypothetical protein HG536_0D00960 [Torulaspora globosa]
MPNGNLENRNHGNDGIGHVPRERQEKANQRDAELGPKSIFYDPDWNAEGKAPSGFKNIPYNERTFTRKNESVAQQLAGLTNIKPPTSSK